MDIQRAKELLTVLAEGVDPLTGEVLPDDHVCNKGEIVRALNCAVEELSRRRKKPLPENNGKPWTEELDDELCRLFDGGSGAWRGWMRPAPCQRGTVRKTALRHSA